MIVLNFQPITQQFFSSLLRKKSWPVMVAHTGILKNSGHDIYFFSTKSLIMVWMKSAVSLTLSQWVVFKFIHKTYFAICPKSKLTLKIAISVWSLLLSYMYLQDKTIHWNWCSRNLRLPKRCLLPENSTETWLSCFKRLPPLGFAPATIWFQVRHSTAELYRRFSCGHSQNI